MSSGPSMANSISNAPRFMYSEVNTFRGLPVLNNPTNIYMNRSYYSNPANREGPNVVNLVVWGLAAYGLYNLVKTD